MTSPLAVAQDALERVQDEPARTRDTALSLLADDDLDATSRVVARWALGRAHHELDDVAIAVDLLATALDEAVSSGLTREAGEIRVSLSVCLFNEGRPDDAFAQLDQAMEELDGAPWARAVMQRALLEHRRGAQHVALDLFDRAQPILVDNLDEVAEARLLANRSALHTYLGHWSEAEADLDRLVVLAGRLDQRMMHAVAHQNLAFLLGRRGKLPRALELFAQSRKALEDIGNPPRLLASLDVDEAELMMTAGLFTEAVRIARGAVEQNHASGNSIAEGDARLLLSQALLQAGKPAEAADHAHRARLTLERDQRDTWAALAQFVGIQASLAQAALDASGFEATTISAAEDLVALLEDQGWLTEALQVRADIAQAAYQSGMSATASDLLRDAPDLRAGGSFIGQLTSWRVEALRRLVAGNERSASRALGAGLRLLERYRATLGATDLRAHASAHGTAIASLGLGLALRRRRAREVLLWSERLRAVALIAQPDVTADEEIGSLLADLKHAQSAVREEISAGSDPWSATQRLRSAESRVTTASRQLDSQSRSMEFLTTRATNNLIDSLGERILIEFVRVGPSVFSVTVDRGVARLRHVGSSVELNALVDRLLFAIRRPLVRRAQQTQREAEAARLIDRMAHDVDALLLGPQDPPREREIILVPTGRLHDVPWGSLPRLRDSPTTVVPSLRLWAEGGRRTDGQPSKIALGIVAAPDLPGAQVEADRLAATVDHAAVLDGPGATPDRALELFETAEMIHIAAHGTFRDESPMFSELHLSGGSLTVHDIERLTRVPRTVVLPACEAGRHRAAAGDELLGTVGTLLSLGVDSVVAPVMAIADQPTVELMTTLHRHLAAGVRPAQALALIRSDAQHLELNARLAAWSFSAFGVRG